MAYDRKGRETLGNISDRMEGIINKCRKQNNRGLTRDEQQTFDSLQEEYMAAEKRIERTEGGPAGRSNISAYGNLEELRDTYRMNPKQQRERADGPHGQAFDAYLRNGLASLSEDQRAIVTAGGPDPSSLAGMNFKNVTSTTTGSQGGYLVPQGFSDLLMQAMKWFGGIDGTVGEFTTETGNPWPWPTVNDTSNIGRIIGQNVQVTQTDPVFNSVTFNSYILSSDLVLVPLALMEDAYFDMNALLANMLGTRIGRLLNQKGTIGTGTNEPTGIVTAANAAGLTNTLANGNTASIAYSDLVNIEHAVDPAYREKGTWMFHDTMLKTLKKLVDGQSRPLWQPGISASFEDGAPVGLVGTRPTILNHPYIINQDMAAPAASAKSIIFGDMSAFKLRKVGKPTVLRLVERYADYLQVGFIGFFRADTNLIDAGTHPLCVNIQSAT